MPSSPLIWPLAMVMVAAEAGLANLLFSIETFWKYK